MNEKILKAIEKMADEVIMLATLIMEDDSISTNIKVDKNTLKDSALRYDLATSTGYFQNGDVVIKALFNNYVEYIERGRKPKTGKRPPISALIDWADKNGIPTDNDTLWAISYAIWRDGYAGRPIFATLEKEIDKQWNSEWSIDLFEELTAELTNYFNP